MDETARDQQKQEIEAMLEAARRKLHRIHETVTKLSIERETVIEHITFLQQQLDREVIASAVPRRPAPNRRSHVLASRRAVSRSENDLAAARRMLDDADDAP